MTRRRKVLFAVALTFALVLGLLLVGELVFRGLAAYERPWRIAWFQRRPTILPYCDPARSFWPGLSWVRTGESPYVRQHRMNSWGYPDTEFGPKNGRYRIAIVGDSVTFGAGVPDRSRIFGSRVEEMLAEAARDPAAFDVVNLGTEGYSLVQVYATVRHVVLPRLDPDLIVYVFSPNDFVDMGIEAYETGGRYPGACFEDEQLDPTPSRARVLADRLQFWMQSESSLYEELRYRVALLRYRVVLPFVTELAAPQAPAWARHASAALSDRFPWVRPYTPACSDPNHGAVAFEHLIELCKSAGVPLVVFSTPTFEFLDKVDDATFAAFFDWFFQSHPAIPVWDPVADMKAGLGERGLPASAICVSENDCHPNDLGHRLLAESLFRFLAEQPSVRERLREPVPDPRSLVVAPESLAVAGDSGTSSLQAQPDSGG
ncbi:MAG: SGNH/GDSL hydrolase family protein [bacterium]